MVRWQPDAKGRLTKAALELYTERGYEQTTVTEIAQRAGVTERTFFRYFQDKREVLFDGSAQLQQQLVDGILAAPGPAGALGAVRHGLLAAAPLFDGRRAYARQRGAAVAATPSLLERELLKLAALAHAAAEALRRRGVEDQAARLAAETGVGVFRVAFEQWTGPPSADSGEHDLAGCIAEAFDRLTVLARPAQT